jgi:hypothetical protein
VYSKIRSQGGHSVDDWSGLEEPFGKLAPYDRPGIRVPLIATLLSLGLWATIWAVVVSVASVALR